MKNWHGAHGPAHAPPLPAGEASAAEARPRTALHTPAAPAGSGNREEDRSCSSPEALGPEVTHGGGPRERPTRGCVLGPGSRGGSQRRAGETEERRGGGRRRRTGASSPNSPSLLGILEEALAEPGNKCSGSDARRSADAGWPGCHGNRFQSGEIVFFHLADFLLAGQRSRARTNVVTRDPISKTEPRRVESESRGRGHARLERAVGDAPGAPG